MNLSPRVRKLNLMTCSRNFLLAIVSVIFSSIIAYASDTADLILTSNNVVTMLGERVSKPLSIAIKDDRIVWVGDHESGEKIRGKHIHFGDHSILPGFIDAHGHASYLAFTSQIANMASPPVGPVKDITDLKSQIKQFIEAAKLKPGEWVMGFGYDDSLLREQRHPNRDDLDDVGGKHPIYLIHVSGHLGTANSLGLSLAGINSETFDPPGGKIRRYEDSSRPNGVLEETAAYPLQRMAMASYKDPFGSIKKAMSVYARNGITTAQDGAASIESLSLLKAAAARGDLIIDVVAYPMVQAGVLPELNTSVIGKYEGRLKLGGVKLVLDGSPQGKTAYLTEPYLKPPQGQGDQYLGYPLIPQVTVSGLVKKYLDAGIPIMAHANGDAAADMLIRAVEEAEISSDHRTVMIHAQTIREDQLDKMKSLKIIPSFFSAHTFYWGDWHRDSVFGPERARRISPTGSTLQRNMPFTVHNDTPIVPPNMIRLLWATTNRITRSGKILGKDQRISIYEALRAITINAAYQHFEEADKGSIEVGKLADLVVLSKDPLQMPREALMELKIMATYSNGEEIFRRKSNASHMLLEP